jgi:leucyl/phenylalanyl-tRNA--protein transferase
VTDVAQPIAPSLAAIPQFRETLSQRLRRWVLGSAYALMPSRIALLPRLVLLSIAHVLAPEAEREKLPEPPIYYSKCGLVGLSDDLSVPALIANYSRGYFPVCHLGAMKWWCPEERAVIDPAATHLSRKVRRLLRQQKFTVTFDRDFAGVMEACARPRPGKTPLTWITPKIMDAFFAAHEAGYAHSVEVWDKTGKLVGGLFGLSIGKVWFGESQFCTASHASKIAMATLHQKLASWDMHVRDGKWMTPHLASFGFQAMPRPVFQALLRLYVNQPGHIGNWGADPRLDRAEWRQGVTAPRVEAGLPPARACA